MPRLSPDRNPSYRKHRASGQAVVTLNGQDFYLGPYGTKASREAYDRHIAEWRSAGKTLAFTGKQDGLTVIELIAAFWEHAQTHYVKPDGSPTSEISNYRRLLKPLKELFGRTLVAEFGPIKLKAVRDRLVEDGISRKVVNTYTHRLRNVFRWGVANELVPPAVHQALSAVEALRRGKTKAREMGPVLPVADDIVQQTLPHMPLVVSDMVRLQRLTAARPEEICLMRPCDVDRSLDEWIYTPMHHKNLHRDQPRVIILGPKAQAILRPYLLRPAESFCFSPRESEKRRREAASERRNTPLTVGNRPGTNRKRSPQRTAHDRYTTNSYRKAIHRACEVAFGMPVTMRYPTRQKDASGQAISKAEQRRLQAEAVAWRKVHCWSPNQLRHAAATEIRREFGLEAAQVSCGHKMADTTQIYAERDIELARRVMRQIG